jgi:hypothetical protein
MQNFKSSDMVPDQRAIQTKSVDGSISDQYERRQHERRQHSLKTIWYSLSYKRRKAVRRKACLGTKYILDVHEDSLLPLMLGLLTLCVADAYLTIVILHHGGIEINPFMAVLLESNLLLFLWVKFYLTSFCIIGLLILKKFTLFDRINGYHLLGLLLVGYTYLIGYELTLLEKANISILM